MLIQYITIVLLSLLLFGCGRSKVDVDYIKLNYSSEVINYFYEVGLHAEALNNQAICLEKWNKDITVVILGDTLLGDRARVKRVIKRLNALELPIKLFLIDDSLAASMHIKFGSSKSLQLAENVGGQGETTHSWNGYIKHATVRIPHPPDNLPLKLIEKRESTIMEEMTQCLGISGDSYVYPLSVFYEGYNEALTLTTLDKQTLQLLYDSALPINYSSEQFENDFAEELYHVNSEAKLLRYLQKESINKQTLREIIQYGLITNSRASHAQTQIIKFNQPIAVIVQGDTSARHLSLLQQAISELNKASDQLQFHLRSDSLNYNGGIRYTFKRVEHLDNPAHSIAVKVATYSTHRLLFHRRYGTNVSISFKDTVTLQQNMPLAIGNTLYQTVSLLNQSDHKFFVYRNDSLQLKPEYKEVLQTYYAPELANNMTKAQLESVLNQMP